MKNKRKEGRKEKGKVNLGPELRCKKNLECGDLTLQ